MVVIANWPVVRIDHWTALLAARAIENQAYVVGLNRTGSDPHLVYSGRSAVFDPHGRAVAQLDDRPGLLTASLDLAALKSIAAISGGSRICGRSFWRSCPSERRAPPRPTAHRTSDKWSGTGSVAKTTIELLNSIGASCQSAGQAVRLAAFDAEEIFLVSRISNDAVKAYTAPAR